MGMKLMNDKSKQTKNTDKRQAILNTTLELIIEQGVQATSMSKVSKKSGVAVGTIYHHFESKEAIITELYRHFKLEMLEIMTKDIQENQSLEAEFTDTVIRLFNYAKSNPAALEFCETFASSPIIDSKIREEVASKFYTFSNTFFQRMQDEGILSGTRKDMLFIYLNGTIFSMLRAHISGQINWTKDDVKAYMKLVWKGLSGSK